LLVDACGTTKEGDVEGSEIKVASDGSTIGLLDIEEYPEV
jgi:hypothetical protein